MTAWTPASARAAVLLTAVIWSSGGLAVKLADCPPLALTGLRCLFCLILFAIVYRRERLLTFSPAQWAGAAAYFLMAFCYTAATKWTTAANAILLQYTAPVFVALLSGIFLGERVTKRDWAVVGLVCAGISLFFVDRASPGGLLGNIVALASGLSYALFIIFTRMQKDASPAGSIFLGNIVALAASAPGLLSFTPTASAIAGGAYYGLVYGGIAFILYSGAIRHVSALTAILIATVEPVLNPVWVYLTIGEKPSAAAVAGGAVVVGSLLARSLLELAAGGKDGKGGP